jgi:signal transduction histidine kinase
VRLTELWGIARFRLTVTYGAMVFVAMLVLLGLIYWQTAGYLGRQVDGILQVEAHAFLKDDPAALPGRIEQDLARDPRHVDLFGLFSRDGVWITGNVRALPAGIVIDGPPKALRKQDGFPTGARALVERLPWGELLVVGRDVTQLAEFQRIILRALVWSGVLMLLAGASAAALVSVQPLRRVRQMQAASARIMRGDLSARLPAGGAHDELDQLAAMVNAMLEEMQRMVAEAKAVGDSVAHDLRTPLTRLRLLLSRAHGEAAETSAAAPLLEQALAEADALLGRFHALLRISEIETQHRRAGFALVDLAAIIAQAEELYAPLAEDRGLTLTAVIDGPAEVEADPEMLFEALANLIDNAIKFTPAGGRVEVRLAVDAGGPTLSVVDNGPGIAEAERALAVQRFVRGERGQAAPGSGLGLSIVAAIAHLHGFALVLGDARPGLMATLRCRPEPFAPVPVDR